MPEQLGEYKGVKEQQMREFVVKAESQMWPRVRFQDGSQTFEKVITPHCTVRQVGAMTLKSWVSRTQIPLTAGWAMSIHKSQGMTLAKVEVDLAKSFEKGQAYVALSRAESLQGLKVISLGDVNCGAALEVVAFYKNTVWE